MWKTARTIVNPQVWLITASLFNMNDAGSVRQLNDVFPE